MATVDSTINNSFKSNLPKTGAKNVILMEDNSFHVESLSSNELVSGQIVFEPLTEAIRDTVMSFYTTNKDLAFDYVDPHDGETYSLYFADPPPKPIAIDGWKPLMYSVTYSVVGS